ncbi:hypothetical protein TREAZ_2252 [Leadbettera azotonutricia ZAS-9]|uniref:Uncharacterized protein n=1 Tax=Leadbettera azotonutricia (strain ATCC BAA-888 / DSM 13862 / ZAS-9) TaxID=545695 RepID=F5Y853_LEAAZ|nr:hypothetical protein TREAZ_2252 [Leadbettera azotonutricia ZAS-9]
MLGRFFVRLATDSNQAVKVRYTLDKLQQYTGVQAASGPFLTV